ncbi:general stress protein (plasmid) [Kozakia baliensis]|uniref:general stress protein n=1 Tax=Kozakia baliensis TaxID=153496 RepID=UPI00345BD17C
MIQHFHDSATFIISPDSYSGGGTKSNFRNDPEKASEAGYKGGQQSSGNFKNNPQKASEASHKSAQTNHKK